MTRTSRTLATLAAATLVLTSCGGSGDATATDPAAAPTGGSTSETPSPTPEMIGDHPAYAHQDYTYELEVRCFCPYFGEPVRITVRDGEVVDAVWSRKSRARADGEQVTDEWLRLSIDDVLEEAANPTYDEVEVVWPEGATHPRRVDIDKMTNAVDDEITYVISHVDPS